MSTDEDGEERAAATPSTRGNGEFQLLGHPWAARGEQLLSHREHEVQDGRLRRPEPATGDDDRRDRTATARADHPDDVVTETFPADAWDPSAAGRLSGTTGQLDGDASTVRRPRASGCAQHLLLRRHAERADDQDQWLSTQQGYEGGVLLLIRARGQQASTSLLDLVIGSIVWIHYVVHYLTSPDGVWPTAILLPACNASSSGYGWTAARAIAHHGTQGGENIFG